jgi:hypothetical protein
MARMLVTPDSAEDLGGEANHLEAEGVFHFLVEDIFDGYLSDGKTAIKNGGLGVKLEVLHGEHKGKKTGITLIDPNTSHKDGGKAAAVKQSAFLIAANVLTFDQINGQMTSYDEQASRGHQIVAELRYPMEDGKKKVNDKGKSYLELHYSNIYHVDDPRVAKVEKDQAMIGLIDSKNRRDEAYFASVAGKHKPAPPKQTTTSPAFDTGGL